MSIKKVSLVVLILSTLLLAVGVEPRMTGAAQAPSIDQGSDPSRVAIPYSGRLTDEDGEPVADGAYDFTFTLYSVESGGEPIWIELQEDVSVEEGDIRTLLGDKRPVPIEALDEAKPWLEVAVRGPQEREFTTLLPRQRLAAAPLSSPAAPAASSNGMACPHDHWGETWSGGGLGLALESSDGNGLSVSAGGDGLHVGSAGSDGSHVGTAGTPSATYPSASNNGFEVAGAQGYGLYVGRADSHGLRVWSAGSDGVAVHEAGRTGVAVGSTEGDGILVGEVGAPSATYQSGSNNGLEVRAAEGYGVYVGRADSHGLRVWSAGSDGVAVREAGRTGVVVGSTEGDGVLVGEVGAPSATYQSGSNNGLEVRATEGYGVYIGRADSHGLRVWSAGGDGIEVYEAGGYAGDFNGDVRVSGNLSKGGGGFKIDHPLDPENAYLYHSFVESPDMMNVYNGNVTLDGSGEAWIELPDWFEALNRDFRYQLTPIGAPGPDLYVAREIEGNRFKIAGGQADLRVSWQVTGIRQDPYAVTNRIPVEEEKPTGEEGTYIHPQAYGMPDTMGLAYKEAQAEESGLTLSGGSE